MDREPAPMTHSPKDMSALVERLRAKHRDNDGEIDWPVNSDGPEAADALESMAAEITALQAKVDEARAVIEPFADAGRLILAGVRDEEGFSAYGAWLRNADFRKAANWLAEKLGEGL